MGGEGKGAQTHSSIELDGGGILSGFVRRRRLGRNLGLLDLLNGGGDDGGGLGARNRTTVEESVQQLEEGGRQKKTAAHLLNSSDNRSRLSDLLNSRRGHLSGRGSLLDSRRRGLSGGRGRGDLLLLGRLVLVAAEDFLEPVRAEEQWGERVWEGGRRRRVSVVRRFQ